MFEGVKGLLFDYGGTLDTDGRHWAPVLWEAYQHACVPVSYEQFRECYVYGERALAKSPIVVPTDTFRDVLQKKVVQQFAYLKQHSYWQPGVEDENNALFLIVDYSYNYVQRHVEKSREVLQQLRKHYPMVLVSNFYGNVEAVLKDFGLDVCFQAIVESAVVGVRKPDPAIYQMGVERLGVKTENVLVIGVSYEKDMLPAMQIGCRTVWLKGEGWTDDAYEDVAVDIVISKIEDLLEVL